jgi:N-acetylmuramoyl-L-alanine amidase
MSPITIMLDPAGDARHAGRTIGDSFERTITLEFAYALKKALESCGDTVMITRNPGDVITQEQKATFANRMMPALYLSIHAYHEPSSKPTIALFRHSYDDSFITKSFDLGFIPTDQAHRTSSAQSAKIVSHLLDLLNQNYHQLCTRQGIFAVPFAPLTAIQCPACAVEFGLPDSSSWQPLVEAIATTIHTILVP